MDYKTVFDVTVSGYKSVSFLTNGIIFTCLGSIILIVQIKYPFPMGPAWPPNRAKKFLIFWTSFAVIWTLVSFASTWGDYSKLRSAFEENRCQIAEGIVTGFVPMPITGHAEERFCVGEKWFHYSDYVITAGFNNTQSHGGPIREGLRVRVSFLGNEIAKLEIAK